MKETYSENAKKLVLEILTISEDTAPINLSFGYTDSNNLCRKGLVIKGAPGKVVKYIVNSPLVLTTSIQPDGLHVLVNS